MSASTQFYLDQAAQCAKSAAAAALPNQRDIYRKAEAAWQAMADRALRTSAERDRRDEERLASAAAANEQQGTPNVQ